MAYFIIVVLIVLLLISWSNKSDNKQSYIDLNGLFQKAVDDNRLLMKELTFYKDRCFDLSRELERLKKQSVTYSNPSDLQNNQEIIEAVKYAMKKSHPDNGGNAEDFKKYRELYNRIK